MTLDVDESCNCICSRILFTLEKLTKYQIVSRSVPLPVWGMPTG